MKNFNNIQNLEIIRGNLYLPKIDTTNGGHAMYLTSSSFSTNKEFIKNTDLKNTNLYKSYFLDYIYKFDLFNINIKKMLKIDGFYDVISRDTHITKTYKKISMYKSNNVFIDLYFYHKLFMNGIDSIKDMRSLSEEFIINNKEYFIHEEYDVYGDKIINEERDYMLLEKFVGKKVLNEYADMLTDIHSMYASQFSTNTLIFNIEDWNDNFLSDSVFNINRARTPISILTALMQTNLDKFKIIPFDILITCGGGIKTKIIPSQCNDNSVDILKNILRRMSNATKNAVNNKSTVSEDELEKNTQLEELVLDVADKINNSIGDNFKQAIMHSFNGEVLMKGVTDIVDKTVDEVSEEIEVFDEDDTAIERDAIEAKVEESLNNNPSFLKALEGLKTESLTGSMSAQNTKRNKMLAEKQMELRINKTGKTVAQILKESNDKKLKTIKIKSNTLNTELTELKFSNFSKQYNADLLDKDTISIISFFKDKRIPVYVLDIQKDDTSDNFNKKYTYTVKMESGDRKRHTLKFDFPKFIDDSFIYLNGNKKNIINQLLLNPVSKTGPDTVQLCSNYNKIFLTRIGTKLSPKIEKFRKSILSDKAGISKTKFSYTTGDSRKSNSDFITTIEYDELSSYLSTVYIDGAKFYMDQNSIRDDIVKKKLKLVDSDGKLLPIAIEGNNIIYLNTDTNIVEIGDCKDSLVDYMAKRIDNVIPGFIVQIDKTAVGKKFMYTIATIMKKHIPIVLLLSYLEGLSEVMNKTGIKYHFSDTRPKVGFNAIVIRFADGYLVCDEDRQPISNSLLLNGLSLIPTQEYNFEDFEKKETYLNIFADLYGNRMILNAFENFYDLFIDPITLEVLKDLNLPTDFVSLVLHGNKLLEDNQYIQEKNLSHYRIRNNEIINAFLYKALATAYSGYRSSASNRSPIPFSIPQDKVIKDIIMSNTVEDFSTLNPPLEAEKSRAISFKGHSGLNQARAYTEEKRAYDKSMKGILAISSPPTGTVGMVRQLGLDANILSPRGYLQITDDDHMENLNSANMFSPAELLTPGCAQKDDAQRVAMTSTQTKHIVPCKRYNKLLLTNGSDDVLAHIISNDFAFKAKEDGIIVDIDEKSNIIVLKYKSGKYDIIETDSKVFKNGGGGFYINNKLTPYVKLNQKIKAGDILAVNENFFDGSNITEDVSFRSGSLAKMAVASSYFTYEDACAITESLSDAMTTQITMKKEVVLGKNSNIDYIVKKGDSIKVGEPLLVFDESYDDEGLNKLLANMSKDDGDDFKNLSKVPVKSKYAGVVEDIKVFYTIDKSEMSKSMASTITNINKTISDKKKTIEKYTKIAETDIILDPIDKVEAQYGKVKGVDIGEGILIEFYINYEDKMGVGDKLTFFTALKGIVSEVIDKGQEPYSEYRPDEEISSFISPISYYARMTDSLFDNMFVNKLLIELKRQVIDIYES